MSKHLIDYFEVKQKGINFYLCKINKRLLSKICKTSIDSFSSGSEIYQRKLDKRRTNNIKNYVNRKIAALPTAIVLNSMNPLVIKDNKIIIDEKIDKFFVIDGQHRIYGLNDYKGDFEFAVSIFDNLNLGLQSEFFVTINDKQKRVNSNVRFNMMSHDEVKTPEKIIYNIALMLNSDKDSPFYHLLRMDDNSLNGELLSLSAFANGVLAYIYNTDYYFQLKEELYEKECFIDIRNKINKIDDNPKYFLWNMYANDREDIIYKILLNYFSAIRSILKDEWGKKDNILCKTTGYNAFMLLFKDIYYICLRDNNNFSFSYIKKLLFNISKLKGKFTVKQWGLGKVAAVNLYRKMTELIDANNSIDSQTIDVLSDEI